MVRLRRDVLQPLWGRVLEQRSLRDDGPSRDEVRDPLNHLNQLCDGLERRGEAFDDVDATLGDVAEMVVELEEQLAKREGE